MWSYFKFEFLHEHSIPPIMNTRIVFIILDLGRWKVSWNRLDKELVLYQPPCRSGLTIHVIRFALRSVDLVTSALADIDHCAIFAFT